MDSLNVTTQPAVEPVTLAEAKLHLRIETAQTAEDDLITALIVAARRQAEQFTGLQVCTATYTWKLDCFPAVLWVPRPPLQSVTSITYLASDGVSTLLAASLYQVDVGGKEPPRKGRIIPAYEEQWPVTRAVLNAVTAVFVAGYGAAADVPSDFKAAIKLIVGDLYIKRENIVEGTIVTEIPRAAEALLAPYRLPAF